MLVQKLYEVGDCVTMDPLFAKFDPLFVRCQIVDVYPNETDQYLGWFPGYGFRRFHHNSIAHACPSCAKQEN